MLMLSILVNKVYEAVEYGLLTCLGMPRLITVLLIESIVMMHLGSH